jgi:hypothetical protein
MLCRSRSVSLAAALIAAALLAPAARAQALYGVDYSNANLYAISTQDGSVRVIGPTGISALGGYNLCGLALGPDGQLITFDEALIPYVFRINPVTGAATLLLGGPYFFGGTTFFEGSIATDASGVLWATGYNTWVFQLDPATGDGTLVASANGVQNIDALEVRSDGALMGLSHTLQSLVRIDLAAHNLTQVASIAPVIGNTSGMAQQNGTTFFSTGGPGAGGSNELYTLDLFSGAASLVGSLSPTITVQGLAGIAESSRPGVVPYCFGQPGAACPCANNGFAGRGCENSAGTGGAWLQALGTSAPDALVLWSSGELPTALTVFLQGSATGTPAVFGDGLRCVAGALKRLYTKSAVLGRASAPQSGDLPITQRSAALGDPIPPGATRYYQAYYRDPSTGFCPAPAGNTWNVSNGLRVAW